MKKILLLTVLLLVGVCTQGATAAVDVDINIGMPPPFDYDEPADVIVVPGTSGYVYMVPEVEGVYFYNGYWYRVYGDRWYRSAYFRGPWNYVRLSLVPRLIIDTPRDYYRYAPSGYYRVPYRDLHRHWRRWGKERHWNRYDWYRHELREDRRWDRHLRDERRHDRMRDDRDRDRRRDDRNRDRLRDERRDDRNRDRLRDERRDDRNRDRLRDDKRDDRRGEGTRGKDMHDGHKGDKGRSHGDEGRKRVSPGERMQEQRSQNPMMNQPNQNRRGD